jgi:hypothetical protein
MTRSGTVHPSQYGVGLFFNSGNAITLAAVAPSVEVTSQPYQYIGGPSLDGSTSQPN